MMIVYIAILSFVRPDIVGHGPKRRDIPGTNVLDTAGRRDSRSDTGGFLC